MRARNIAVGLGPASTPLEHFVRETYPPTAPQNLRVMENTFDSIELAWDAPENIGDGTLDAYEMQRTGDGSTETWLITDTDSLTLTDDRELQGGTTYNVRLSL